MDVDQHCPILSDQYQLSKSSTNEGIFNSNPTFNDPQPKTKKQVQRIEILSLTTDDGDDNINNNSQLKQINLQGSQQNIHYQKMSCSTQATQEGVQLSNSRQMNGVIRTQSALGSTNQHMINLNDSNEKLITLKQQQQQIALSQSQSKMQPKQLLFNNNHHFSGHGLISENSINNAVITSGSASLSPNHHLKSSMNYNNLASQYCQQQLGSGIAQNMSSSFSPKNKQNQQYYTQNNSNNSAAQQMNVHQNIQQFYLKNEDQQQRKSSDIDSSINEQVQITDSSWIDWDDKQKLESHLNKQKSLEQHRMFDPMKYFGGLKVQDLNNPPEDPRFTEMFENEVTRQLSPNLRHKVPNGEQMISQNTKKIVQNYYQKQNLSNNQSLLNYDSSFNKTFQNNSTAKYNQKSIVMSPNHAGLVSNTKNLFSNLKQQQVNKTQNLKQSVLSKNNSPSQKVLQQQTSISKLIYQQLEQSMENLSSKKLKNQLSVTKLPSYAKKSPKIIMKTNLTNSHISNTSKQNLKVVKTDITDQQNLNLTSSYSNLQQLKNYQQTINKTQMLISSGIYSIKHCLSTGASPNRIIDNQIMKTKNQNLQQQNNQQSSKTRISPFGRLKISQEDSILKLKEKLSPSVATVAQKYMKNANRLQSGSTSAKHQSSSQLQIIKSFLSQGHQANNLNLSKDSSIDNGNNQINQKSILTKSTERIYVDLSSSQNTSKSRILKNSISNKISSMISSPINSAQKHKQKIQYKQVNGSSNVQNKSQQQNGNSQNYVKKNFSKLNNAIYETLIVNKTSMLKKTTTEMGQVGGSSIIDNNLLKSANSSKRNESRNNIPKPATSMATKLHLETQYIHQAPQSQTNTPGYHSMKTSQMTTPKSNLNQTTNSKYKQKVVTSKNLYSRLVSPTNNTIIGAQGTQNVIQSERLKTQHHHNGSNSLSHSQFKF
eukprot:403333200